MKIVEQSPIGMTDLPDSVKVDNYMILYRYLRDQQHLVHHNQQPMIDRSTER